MYEYQIVVRKISEVSMIEYVKNLDSELSEKSIRYQFIKEHPEYDAQEYTIEISCFEPWRDLDIRTSVQHLKPEISD